jgi:hypothetical protein
VLHAPRPRSSSRDEDDAPTLEVGAEFLDEAGLAALGVSLDFTAEASRESAEDFEVVKDDELLG